MDYLNYAFEKIALLAQPTYLKILVSGFLAILSFLFGNLYSDALTAIVMLMVFDTVLGVVAAYATNEPITSRRFGRSVVKGIIYMTSISAGYFADLTIPYAFIQSTMIGFVGVTEFISILENIGRLGYKTPKKLLNSLQNEYLKK